MAKRCRGFTDTLYPPKSTRSQNIAPIKKLRTGNAKEEDDFQVQLMKKLSCPNARELKFPVRGLVNGSYNVLQFLGCGSYGNVFKVKDRKSGSVFAMKVIKSQHQNFPYLLREVEVLRRVNSIDPDGLRSLCVKLLQTFTCAGQLCIVYEMLGTSVLKILALNKDRGLPAFQVRHITYQLCIALNFLHENGIVHHDVKPDNVAFVDGTYDIVDGTSDVVMRRADIRLIDFGSAVFSSLGRATTPTTRAYTAPEMGLRQSWSFKTDIWSLGCSVFEMLTGKVLLPCASEADKCYMIQFIFQEEFPPQIGLHCYRNRTWDCFDKLGRLKRTARGEEIEKTVKRFHEYNTFVYDKEANLIFHLMKQMLRVNQFDRISAVRALTHPCLLPYFVPC